MKILALDSTALTASVALTENSELLAEYTLRNGNTHSETLLPMIESAMKMLSLSVSDIDLFACSAGPGSFTGVRIGAATVKGLAFGSEKPCVGVSTLEALAYNLVGYCGLICPVMNARRSQVYTALFRSDGKTLTRLMEDSALPISELDTILAEYGESVRFCGDGYDITIPELKKCGYIETPERLRHQSAYSVAVIAAEKFANGEFLSDTELVATYLRPSQAERELAEKMKNA
ncbi:MAG: tRNA (adenosine(37)-N6)-threonylcarbamoyltransferase complex dimerization subunit type 1 TsaB [Ruminococcaceae bacterium]|nr:tRNA (adenosine(37)-N6)-threonylcarbamoyltransferase complex dimerization subunit type 1 TsaB [Oscillospiraceae bacterium]